MNKKTIRILVVFLFSIGGVIAVALRIHALSRYLLIDGDSAVFGLMAKHIYQFQEFPAYLWLNHYAGALVSYIGALFFAVFGVSPFVYSLTGLVLSCCWVIAAIAIVRKILDLPGAIAAVGFVFVPPTRVLFYSLYPGGVQAETLLFASIILFLLLGYNMQDKKARFSSCFWLGFLSGCGLWLSPGIFPSLLTVLTVFMLKDKKVFLSNKIVVFAAGLLIGHLPAIVHNIYYPGATFLRLGGRFLNVSKESLGSGNAGFLLAQGLWQRILMIPNSLAQIPVLMIKLLGTFNAILFFIAGVVVLTSGYRSFAKDKIINAWVIFLIYGLWVVIFYSIAVGINAPRYMLGFSVLFPFVVGKFLSLIAVRNKAFFGLILAVILVTNGMSIHNAWATAKLPGYADLTSWLMEKKYNLGFTDYSTAYPVVLYSNEKILLSPTIFGTAFSERYPAYTQQVRNAANPVYIIDTQEYPLVVAKMERRLPELGVNYRKNQWDRFVVYHDLSRKVYPQELKLTEQLKINPGD